MSRTRERVIAIGAFVIGAAVTFLATRSDVDTSVLSDAMQTTQARPLLSSPILPPHAEDADAVSELAPLAISASPTAATVASSPTGAPVAKPQPVAAGTWSNLATPVPQPSFSPVSAATVENTAFVTMASDDFAGRLAVTLMQSLRDVGTTVPHLVVILMRGGIGSKNCLDYEWKKRNSRIDVGCGQPNNIAPEIVSEEYLTALADLGVETIIMDPIPLTDWTKDIPGGPQIFWGMAFNKLKVFSLTQFRKVVWLDADDYFVRNVDHLMEKPMLTGSIVTACCNVHGPGYAGGGIWVLEPSETMYQTLLDTISKPKPGTNPPKGWTIGDMEVIRSLFGAPPAEGASEPVYPAINDLRHGYVGGLRHFPAYAHLDAAGFDGWMAGLDARKPRREGFIEEYANPSGFPSWRALDMRYDQCVGNFKCSPERDAPEVVFSVHFSCLQTANKPSNFESEHDLMHTLITYADGHTRAWFLRWYDTYKKAMKGSGLPAPLWTGSAVPGYNATHDELAEAARKQRGL